VPFLGICLGMQCAVIETARNLAGLQGANSAEFDPDSPHPVISLMDQQRNVVDKGGTMRLGSYPCQLAKGSLAGAVYSDTTITERHRHRFEFNNAYRDAIAAAGLVPPAFSRTDGWWRYVERPESSVVHCLPVPTHEFKSVHWRRIPCSPRSSGRPGEEGRERTRRVLRAVRRLGSLVTPAALAAEGFWPSSTGGRKQRA
jgi:CTP synthase (UTP-ammonia lyase)